MNRFPCVALTAALLEAAVAGPVAGQAPVLLSRGHAVPGTVGRSDTARYTVQMPAGGIAFGDVNQIDFDAVVSIFAPDGRRIAVFDDPARGPEVFEIRSAAAGAYRIEVTPFERDSGAYFITLRLVDRLASRPADRIDQIVAPWTGRDRPGGVVAVVRGGRVLFMRGYGLANAEDGLPNRPDTPFHLASVSKQFTAFAVAMLADQGRLALDDDVRRHLPELPDFGGGRTITLRHLLNHTSGLRDQWELWAMAGGRLDDVIREADLLRLVARQRELNFAPGSQYLYCNTGYTLLAEVVARVTNRPFPEWMREQVFAPLGMTATQVYDNHERMVPGRAYAYAVSADGGVRKAVLSYANMGATSLFASATDLVRWLRNWRTGEVGGARVLAAMQQRGVLARGDTIPYALGVVVDTFRGLRRIAHGGSDAGFRSYVAYYPSIDAGVIVLANWPSFNPQRIATAAVEAFFGDALGPAATAAAPPATPAAAAPAPPWAPDSAALSVYVGAWYSPELETVYTVALDGGRLVARHRRHGDIALAPRQPDRFQGNQWFFQQVRFERDSAGTVTRMRLTGGRVHNLLLERLRN